jgi:hypothetical protein
LLQAGAGFCPSMTMTMERPWCFNPVKKSWLEKHGIYWVENCWQDTSVSLPINFSKQDLGEPKKWKRRNLAAAVCGPWNVFWGSCWFLSPSVYYPHVSILTYLHLHMYNYVYMHTHTYIYMYIVSLNIIYILYIYMRYTCIYVTYIHTIEYIYMFYHHTYVKNTKRAGI